MTDGHLLKLLDKELAGRRDAEIAHQMTGGHSRAVATQMVDAVYDAIRGAAKVGKFELVEINGRVAVDAAQLGDYCAEIAKARRAPS